MAAKNYISHPGQFNNMGGETLNRVVEGVVIGATTGAVLGIVLGFLAVTRVLVIPGLEQANPWLTFVFSMLISALCFGGAGAVVGIGIPRFNTRPDQGPIKRWRSVVVTKGQHREVFFVPEEKRSTLNGPNHAANWKRNPAPPQKDFHPPTN